jgi:quercetin dioxygenase-like cupin family protein
MESYTVPAATRGPLSTGNSMEKKRTIVNPVIGDSTTFIKTAAETGGDYTEVLVTLQPGGGTPRHFHRNIVEHFTAIDGVLGLEVNGKKQDLQPGHTMTLPVGVVHRFFNAGAEPVRFRTVTFPGCEGFENSLRILYGLAADGLTNSKAIPKQFVHLALLSVMSDMYLPGPMRLLEPLIRRVAAKARKNGVEEILLNKYCR